MFQFQIQYCPGISIDPLVNSKGLTPNVFNSHPGPLKINFFEHVFFSEGTAYRRRHQSSPLIIKIPKFLNFSEQSRDKSILPE